MNQPEPSAPRRLARRRSELARHRRSRSRYMVDRGEISVQDTLLRALSETSTVRARQPNLLNGLALHASCAISSTRVSQTPP